jgi:signal transduction histidine kinase
VETHDRHPHLQGIPHTELKRDSPVHHPKCVHFHLLAILLMVWLPNAVVAEPPPGTPLEKGPPIVIGQTVVPLLGPWSFHIGDSPTDPLSRAPLWAEPDFDDSGWERLSLGPTGAAQNESAGESDLVPGWTGRGHAGYAGFAWYRIRLNLETRPWEKLALAGPVQVDDAYQVFLDGKLLGSFGDFTRGRPVSYYSQPMFFPFSAGGPGPASAPQVIAFRVWMERNTLLTATDEVGGLRSAPLIGETNAVAVRYQMRWHELIRSYSPFVIDALSFALLAILAFSLILFDRSDRVYLWMGIALTLMAAYSTLGAFDVWTQHLSILEDSLIQQYLIGPLAYVGWFMVWWLWFDRKGPAWMPITAAGLTAVYMVSTMMAVGLLFSLIPRPVADAFEVVSLIARLLFFALMSWMVVRGIRRHGLEGWLVLPAVLLLAIAPFQNELQFLHLSPHWFLFGTQITLAQVANLALALGVGLLLLRRLLHSVRRQRLIEVDAKRAQLQSDFVAAVSHEFRSPLTTLRTITDLLAQGRIADEGRRQQSYIFLDRETTRLQRLVEDLLDFGRMESGRKQYRFAKFDAFQLVRAAVTDISEQAEAEGFRIETNLVTVPASIRADEEALRRAVRNLLENAMKYSPECRTVWVDGAINDHRVSISVRDRGMGVEASEQLAIFQKFVRGDAAKKAGIKGTGIGLAMAQQISEAMGGGIQLHSEVGVGSTFTIVLPLAEE